MQNKFDISQIENHLSVAQQLSDFIGDEKIILFDAPMGSGKTTFIKALCQYLGTANSLSSPTYSIVNEYETPYNKKIYHFDLYRLKSTEELLGIGFEDYLDSGNYVFIEWPEIAMPFLENYVRIIINTENNKRYLCAEIFA